MRWFQVGLVLCFMFAQSTQAAIPMPIPQAQHLKVYWNGFHAASLITGWERQKNGVVKMQAAVRTYGLAGSVSRYRSDSVSYSKNGVPQSFHTQFSHRKSSREIKLKWNNQFKLTHEYNHPPEKKGKRTTVPKSHKDNAYDPLTAFFVARAKVMSGAKKFTLPMYDGRRHSQVQFAVLGKRENGDIHVTMREIFLAGYTGREQKERAERDITIHIYVDPKTFIPVGGMGQSPIGTAVGELAASCDTFAECLKNEN